MRRVAAVLALVAAIGATGCSGRDQAAAPSTGAPQPPSSAAPARPEDPAPSSPPTTGASIPVRSLRQPPFTRVALGPGGGLDLARVDDEMAALSQTRSQWVAVYMRPLARSGEPVDPERIVDLSISPVEYMPEVQPFDYDTLTNVKIGTVNVRRGEVKTDRGRHVELFWSDDKFGFVLKGPAVEVDLVAPTISLAPGSDPPRLRVRYGVPPGYLATNLGEPASSILHYRSLSDPTKTLRLEIYQTRVDREILLDYYGVETELDERSIGSSSWWFTRDVTGREQAGAIVGDASVRFVAEGLTRADVVAAAQRLRPITDADFAVLASTHPAG